MIIDQRALVLVVACLALAGCTGSSQDQEPTPTPEEAAVMPPVSGETVDTPSGLGFIEIQEGVGETPKEGQTVVVSYTAWLANGAEIDSAGRFEFTLGTGEVIAGWDQALATMQVGSKRRLIIPPELAYGEAGVPPLIPPNAELIFDIELLAVR